VGNREGNKSVTRTSPSRYPQNRGFSCASLFKIEEPRPPAPSGLAVLRLGFRPFYLLAAMLAAVSVPIWILVVSGQMTWAASISPFLWHTHEMLFGFASAVIIGFLMTAAKTWTGLATPRGPFLGILALLWVAARVAAVTMPYAIFAIIDMLLLPIVAVILVKLLARAGNKRNLPLAGLLLLLIVANASFHLAVLGALDIAPTTPLHAALGLIVLIECVMAGRVVPAFTMSATAGLRIKTSPIAERVTLGLTAMGLLFWLLEPVGWIGFVVLAAAAGWHLNRLMTWQSLTSRNKPVVWILHAAYLWIPVGLALLSLSQMGWLPASAGIHALSVGATGGLIIGMMTRTARGHTGRQITVKPLEICSYLLVMAAAVIRVWMPIFWPGHYQAAVALAAFAWSLAFLIYLWVYTPWLVSTRLDGKDG